MTAKNIGIGILLFGFGLVSGVAVSAQNAPAYFSGERYATPIRMGTPSAEGIRTGYAVGVVDSIAGVLVYSPSKSRQIAGCIRRRTHGAGHDAGSVRQIVDGFVLNNPNKRYFSMASLVFDALGCVN